MTAINESSSYSTSYRVEDGMLLDEITELAINGGDRVPSSDDYDYDAALIIPAPEVDTDEEDHDDINSETAKSSIWDLTFGGKYKNPGKAAQSKQSKYKQPASSKFVKEIMTPLKHDDASGGLIWKASIVPDNFDRDFKKNGALKMCKTRDYDAKKRCIKPRRGNLLVKSSDFFGSLVKFSDEDEEDDFDINIFETKDRWAFSGVLCGFPSLTTLEVLKIEYKRSALGNIHSNWTTHWKSGKHDVAPTFPDDIVDLAEVRAILRSPSYSMNGWSKDSRGYVFWFEGNGTRDEARLTYGTNMIRQFQKESILVEKPDPKCVRVHMISHRYAVGNKQKIKDQLTYHSLALLEWDHGEYCTVVEVGYLGGLTGNMGRSNWIEDKMKPINSLYRCLPPEMIHPWKSNLSEIRLTNVKAKNLNEHVEYMKRYTGQDQRFIDVKVTFSHNVRLTFSSRVHIAQYLVNYISRDKTYSEIRANCQTFAADFCAFLAGKKDVQPYHPINRVQYHNQSHHFVYEPSMYQQQGH